MLSTVVMTTDNSSNWLSPSNDIAIVKDLIGHQQRYSNGHRIWRIPHQICVWDKEGMFACSGLERCAASRDNAIQTYFKTIYICRRGRSQRKWYSHEQDTDTISTRFKRKNQNWKLHKEEFQNLCLILLGRLNQPHWDGRTCSTHDSPKHPSEDTTCRIWVQMGRRPPMETVRLQSRPCGRHKGNKGERRYNGTLLDGRDIDKRG